MKRTQHLRKWAMCQWMEVIVVIRLCRRNFPRKYFDCSVPFSGPICTSLIIFNSSFPHIYTSAPRSFIRKIGSHRRWEQHQIFPFNVQRMVLRQVYRAAVSVSFSRFAALCLFRLNWKRSQQLFRCRVFGIFIFELMHTTPYIAPAEPISSFAIYLPCVEW